MITRIVTMLLILLIFPVPVSAEIYKYRDQNGVLRFTDNLTEVPVAQREHIEQYQEIKTTTGVAEQTPANAPGPDVVQDPKAVEKELTDEKEMLDNEYSQLTQTRSSLESSPQPGTPEEIVARDKKIQDYNIQLNIYNVKLKAFREKLQTYQEAAKEKP